MRKYRCTHVLITDPIDIEYISGFCSSRAALLVAPENDFLLTDFRYREAAEKFCAKNLSAAGRRWRFVPIKENGFLFLAPLVPPGSVVGIQSDVVTVDEQVKLKKALRGVHFVSISGEISGLALAKTQKEVRAMQKAARIADQAFARFLRLLRPGITERDAAAIFDRLAVELGSERCAFDTIVLFGERTSLPHGRPGRHKLKKGDLVLVDAGCTAGGLCSDMTRTMVCGTPSPRQAELYGVAKKALAAALRAARAGIIASSLDRAARSVIEKAGYGPAFGHGLGHGVGRRVHERPRVSSQSKEILPQGSVITIEPGIYLPGFGGVRIEDMVVLHKNGSRLLTHAPRELVEL